MTVVIESLCNIILHDFPENTRMFELFNKEEIPNSILKYAPHLSDHQLLSLDSNRLFDYPNHNEEFLELCKILTILNESTAFTFGMFLIVQDYSKAFRED